MYLLLLTVLLYGGVPSDTGAVGTPVRACFACEFSHTCLEQDVGCAHAKLSVGYEMLRYVVCVPAEVLACGGG